MTTLRQMTIPDQWKKTFCILLTISILFLGIYCIFSTKSASAEVTPMQNTELSFKSVYITGNDTLWSIAKENYTKEQGSMEEYINEIKRCNSLSSDRINAGSSIIVPVYLSYCD